MYHHAFALAAALLAGIAAVTPADAGDAAITPAGWRVANITPLAASNGGMVTVTGVLPTDVAWNCMGTCAVWLRPVTADQDDAPVVALAGVMRAVFSVRVARSALGAAFTASVYRWRGDGSYALMATGTGEVR